MKRGLKIKSRSLSYDLPGFVDVQEAIPAASSTAKPQTEEVMSQGEASEPLAQECLRGNGNSRKPSEKHRFKQERTKDIYGHELLFRPLNIAESSTFVS